MKRAQKIFSILLLAFLAVSCNETVLRVENWPENTPKDGAIFVAGNFNNWNPSDQRYRLKQVSPSVYEVLLPAGIGSREFKFTRGDWTSIETDVCGRAIPNRKAENGSDTLICSIESWKDLDPVNCREVTIVVNKVPESTPENDPITIAGSFNTWQTDSFLLKKDSVTGKRYITIRKPEAELREYEFVFTRGSLERQEADSLGVRLPPRKLELGKYDTLELSIENWEDQIKQRNKYIRFIINNLPDNTPQDAEIFLANNQNGWNPRDYHYKFERNAKGQLELQIPKIGDWLEYKLTRGDWKTVEVDYYGLELPNRKVNLNTATVEYVDVKNWNDLSEQSIDEIELIVQVPDNTPENDKLYMVSAHHQWKYKLSKTGDQLYSISLPANMAYQEYKITRGNWGKVEIAQTGQDIGNRRLTYGIEPVVRIEVENWRDLYWQGKSVRIVLKDLPANTSDDDTFYLASNINGWNARDSRFQFEPGKANTYYLDVELSSSSFEYKITRGEWGNHECQANREDIENRNYDVSMGDFIEIEVEKWH